MLNYICFFEIKIIYFSIKYNGKYLLVCFGNRDRGVVTETLMSEGGHDLCKSFCLGKVSTMLHYVTCSKISESFIFLVFLYYLLN